MLRAEQAPPLIESSLTFHFQAHAAGSARHHPHCVLDVAGIAKEIRKRFAKTPPALTALMVRGHGATVWGRTLQEAYNRFECLEFVLSYMARTRR